MTELNGIGVASVFAADAELNILTGGAAKFDCHLHEFADAELVEDGEFVEVFVDTPIGLCEQRDPKGLYKKARAGEIKDFTGIHQPYECSTNAELVIRSDEMTVDAAADAVIALLRDSGIIS